MNRFSAPEDNCASLAPFLTELFDGEADDQSAARARAHLLSCQECARLWLDWNQHRNILRNDNAPAPPPTLLWRVLVACRVSTHNRTKKRARSQPELALHQLEAPLPGDLSAHILARTTRKPISTSGAVMLTPTVSRHRRASRFGQWPLMAAPALALFLLILGRADFNADLAFAPPRPGDAISLQQAAPATAPQRQLSAPAKTKTIRVATASPVAPIAPPARSISLLATRPPVARTAAPATAATSRPRARTITVNLPRSARAQTAFPEPLARRRTQWRTDASLSRMITIALDATRRNETAMPGAPASARDERGFGERGAIVSRSEFEPRHRVSTANVSATPSARGASLKLAALTAKPRVITTSAARLRPASFSGESSVPQSRVALSNTSAPRSPQSAPGDDNQNLRVSRPAPFGPGVRLASLRATETSGPRLEDLRSAVDDFRASISDNPGDGWDG